MRLMAEWPTAVCCVSSLGDNNLSEDGLPLCKHVQEGSDQQQS